MNDNISDRIKQSVTMRDVCNHFGIRVAQNKAICPFHSDTKPSMQIYDGRRGYYCFVCNQGGSVIDFVMQYNGLDYINACKYLNDSFHLGLDINGTESKRSEQERIEAARKRSERERYRQELSRLQSTCERFFAEWVRLDRIMAEKAPDGPLDDFDAEWCDAIKRIDGAWFDAVTADSAVTQFERQAT